MKGILIRPLPALWPMVALLLALLAALPLFYGLPASHDWLGNVFRLQELDASLKDGILYPRWAPNMAYGYGYPYFNYYAPLARYLAEGFHLFLGLPFAQSVRAAYISGFVLAAAGMYLWTRDLLRAEGIEEIWARPAAAVAGAAYAFLPYRLVQVYVRGDLAESLASALFPLSLWALQRFLRSGSLGSLLIAQAAYAAVILSHNLMAVAFTPIFLAYGLFLAARLSRPWSGLRRLLAAVLGGLLLSTFYWLPALWESGYVHLERALEPGRLDFHEHFVHPQQFLWLNWGYGGSLPGLEDSMSFQLGSLHVALGILALLLAGVGWHLKKQSLLLPHTLFFLGVALFLLFLITPFSLWLWELLPSMSYFQFPWRLLAPTGLATSLLVGLSVAFLALTSPRWAIALSLAAMAAIPSLYKDYAQAQGFLRLTPEEERATLRALTSAERGISHYGDIIGFTVGGEYMPRAAQIIPRDSSAAATMRSLSEQQKIAAIEPPGTARIEYLEHNSYRDRVGIEAREPVSLSFNTIAFPGWVARIDGERAPIAVKGPLGLITLALPAGKHRIELDLEPTLVQAWSSVLSGLSLLLLLISALWVPPRKASLLALLLLGAAGTRLLWLSPEYDWLKSRQGTTVTFPNVTLGNFGNEIQLLGLGVGPRSARQGETVVVNLLWQALKGVDKDYTIYVHLRDETDAGITQEDRQPLMGEYPTNAWQPGQVVRDRFQIEIPRHLAPGSYRLVLGLYSLSSMEALPLLDSEGRPLAKSLELGQIKVDAR